MNKTENTMKRISYKNGYFRIKGFAVHSADVANFEQLQGRFNANKPHIKKVDVLRAVACHLPYETAIWHVSAGVYVCYKFDNIWRETITRGTYQAVLNGLLALVDTPKE